jgi:hypothetical protein
MTMQIDVLSATATGDGTLVPFPTRIKGVVITTTAGAGSVILKDGGASGTTLLTLNTPAVAEMFNALLPGQGIRFRTDVYVDLTNVSSITVFYD